MLTGNNLIKYLALAKVDEQTHIVSGVATAEVIDADGEIADFEGCVDAYTTWATEASEPTINAGQEASYGNVRWQHNVGQIAGKLVSFPEFRRDKKEIAVRTVPIDESTWTKIKKAFVRAFSHGGQYAWRICETCHQAGLRTQMPLDKSGNPGFYCPVCEGMVNVRYKPILAEISYVDAPNVKPAIFEFVKSTVFEFVKADGTHEMRKFAEGEKNMETTIEQPVATAPPAVNTEPPGAPVVKAAEPAHALGIDTAALTKQITDSVVARLTLQKAVKYLATDEDGTTHLPYTGEDGKPDHKLMGAAWAALHGGYRGNKYKGADKDKAVERLKGLYSKEGMETPSEKCDKQIQAIIHKAAEKKGLKKGMYEVGRFADVLQTIAMLQWSVRYEREMEGDDSTLPEDLTEDLTSLAGTFLDMAEEEVHELTAAAEAKKGTKDKMNENTNPALAKARKSVAEHIQKAKDMVTDHCDKMCKLHKANEADMHDHIDKIHGMMLGNGDPEPEKKAAGSGVDVDTPGFSNEPGKIDPEARGTHVSYDKAQVDTMVKAAVEAGVSEAINALVKAMSADDEEEEDGKPKPKGKKEDARKSMPSNGIGDRSEPSFGGPALRVMPIAVTKTQDGQELPSMTGGGNGAAPTMTAEEITKAVAGGDIAAQLRLMKGARRADHVPPTLTAFTERR